MGGGHKRMGLVKNNTERAWNRTRRQSSRNVMSIKKITLRTVISLPYVSRGSHPIPIAISYLHCRVEHSNSQHLSLLFAPITLLPLLLSFSLTLPIPTLLIGTTPRGQRLIYGICVFIFTLPFSLPLIKTSTSSSHFPLCLHYSHFYACPFLYFPLNKPSLPTSLIQTASLLSPATNNNILVCTVLPESLYI